MEFEYEIQPDDYAAASVIYAKLLKKSRKFSPWLYGGAILVIVFLLERDRGLSPVLLGAIGVWWMWAGFAQTFPGAFRSYYRRHYQKLRLGNRKYKASVEEPGFVVDGDDTTWRVRWQDVSPKGEDNEVFMFYARGTLFIFAKRYLSNEAQQQLRLMAGLQAG